MNKLIRNIIKSDNSYALIGNMAFSTFSFIGFLILVRLLNKETYGTWVIFLSIVGLLEMIRHGLSGTGAIRIIAYSNKEAKEKHIAASYQLNAITSAYISSVSLLTGFISWIISPGSFLCHALFSYPLLSFASLPINQSLMLSQAEKDFKKFMKIRISSGFIIQASIIITSLFTKKSEHLITSLIFSNLAISCIYITLGWDKLRLIKLHAKAERKKIFSFGKFSTASSIASNLLRSSDAFIIGLSSVMGPASVAIYSIPFKLVELVEIPLRSFTSTAYPSLSKLWKHNKPEFKKLLSKNIILSSILFIPIVLSIAIFPEWFLSILGGNEYLGSLQTQKNIAIILSIYVLFLPLDRYSGMGLFAINKPKANFTKIIFMLISNIAVNILAVFVFNSLELVAVGSVFFTLIGIVTGYIYLFKFTGYTLSFAGIRKNISTTIKETIRI